DCRDTAVPPEAAEPLLPDCQTCGCTRPVAAALWVALQEHRRETDLLARPLQRRDPLAEAAAHPTTSGALPASAQPAAVVVEVAPGAERPAHFWEVALVRQTSV